MKIVRTKRFEKDFKKMTQPIKINFEKRISLFLSDEFYPLLHNHKLNSPWDGYRSIDITGDVRVIYKKDINTYTLYRIDTHSELYE